MRFEKNGIPILEKGRKIMVFHLRDLFDDGTEDRRFFTCCTQTLPFKTFLKCCQLARAVFSVRDGYLEKAPCFSGAAVHGGPDCSQLLYLILPSLTKL